MDLGTTITALIVICVCILPFALISYSNKKRRKQILNTLIELANQNNTCLMQVDIWHQTGIGIDKKKEWLFFVKYIDKVKTPQKIACQDISKCIILNNSRNEQHDGSQYSIVDNLELCFIHQDKNKEDVKWEFYNSQTNTAVISGEKQLVEKWHKISNIAIAISVVNN